MNDSATAAPEFFLSETMRKLAAQILWDLIDPCRKAVGAARQKRGDAIQLAERQLADAQAECDSINRLHETKNNAVQSKVRAATGELDGNCGMAESHLRGLDIAVTPPTINPPRDEPGVPPIADLNAILEGVPARRSDLDFIRRKTLMNYWPDKSEARWAIGCSSLVLLLVFLPLVLLWPVFVFSVRFAQAAFLKSHYRSLAERSGKIKGLLIAFAGRSAKETTDAVRANNEKFLPPALQLCARAVESANQTFQKDVERISNQFTPVSRALHDAVASLWTDSHYAGKDWDSSDWKDWGPDASPDFAARIGKLILAAEDLQAELSSIDFTFTLPALIPFAEGRALLLRASGKGKHAATQALQSTLIRALANTPAGKARFTLIDPVGLGHNCADFMHLGDVNPELICGKAWTEPQHIEQQLTRITEEMETVIQKYLRNRYASIREYNQANHEIPEPFRFLVIFDFPVNFNDASIRRLLSIVKNGPRCGVFTLMLFDSAVKLPYGCDAALEELLKSCVILEGIDEATPGDSARQFRDRSRSPSLGAKRTIDK